MGSPTQGAWECRHGVYGRDDCAKCFSPAVQDVDRAILNLERILYSIPSDGTAISLRFHDGRIEIADPEWHLLALDYGDGPITTPTSTEEES